MSGVSLGKASWRSKPIIIMVIKNYRDLRGDNTILLDAPFETGYKIAGHETGQKKMNLCIIAP